MATTTFAGLVRSNGGDDKRSTYAGSMLMVAQFFITLGNPAGTDVRVTETDTSKVILPKNTVVTNIIYTPIVTGGNPFPNFTLGYTDADGGTNFVDTDAYVFDADVDTSILGSGTATIFPTSSPPAGVALGNQLLAPTERIKIVGGDGSSSGVGNVRGLMYYYVKDNGKASDGR